MKYLFWFCITLFLLCVEILFGHYLSVFDLKINLVFLNLLILILKEHSIFPVLIGGLLGLVVDVYSHGMVGVYATSFFLVLLSAYFLGRIFYKNNLFSIIIFTCLFSLAEGLISIMLLRLFSDQISWNSWFLEIIAPLSLIHSAISPILLLMILYLEKLFKIFPED